MQELNQIFINENCEVTKDFAIELDKLLAKKVQVPSLTKESKAFIPPWIMKKK